MHFSCSSPNHTYFPANSFTPRLASTLLHDDELCISTRQNYLINLRLRHLIILSQIMFKSSLTPTPLYVHALLSHISIGTIESSPFVLPILVSLGGELIKPEILKNAEIVFAGTI